MKSPLSPNMFLGLFLFTLSVGVAVGCAWLTPTVKNAEVTIEKHGAAYETCAKTVLDDAVLSAGAVVAQAIDQNIPPSVAAQIMHLVSVKEIEALQACANGMTPEKLWSPNETPGAGPTAPTPGAPESRNDTPAQHF